MASHEKSPPPSPPQLHIFPALLIWYSAATNIVSSINATTVSPPAEKNDNTFFELNLILVICCVYRTEISDVLNFCGGGSVDFGSYVDLNTAYLVTSMSDFSQ